MAVVNGDRAAGIPSNTLYCSNLPDKLQKDDLKRALYMLFTTYGPVLDIVALKTPKMRGQAHVLFRDKDASTQALRSLEGFDFFGKTMKISYAKTKSDTLAKLDGTYKQPPPTNPETQPSAVQQSVFAGPPGTGATTGPGPSSASLGPPPTLKPADAAVSPASATTPASQGIKRAREDSGDEGDGQGGDEAPMDMDDAAMDESEDD